MRTFAQNYLKEAALKAESGFITEKCIEILGTDDEQVRTFALNYLKEPALKDGDSHITRKMHKDTRHRRRAGANFCSKLSQRTSPERQE